MVSFPPIPAIRTIGKSLALRPVASITVAVDDPSQPHPVTQHLLADATKRHRYRHKFSLAGFKTLILMNGGAMISLQTYLGHGQAVRASGRLSMAIAW
jgi:hypothetical protein